MTATLDPGCLPGAPLVVLDGIAGRVERRIADVLDEDATRWRKVDPRLDLPLTALRQVVLSGGKRLRPAFCYWAFVGTGGDPDDPRIVDTCAALELLHAFALIHDDVMDDSARRHGVATVHESMAAAHGRAGWRGDPGRFGTGAAILAGDLAFVYSDRLLGSLPSTASAIWHELRLEVIAGQYLDLVGTAQASVSPELARRISRYKTGKYSVERPLHLGAAFGEPDGLESVLAALSRFGAPLGEAFQLRDDLLGVFGDPRVTGKPVGEDLRDGKPTLLYALARRAAGAHESQLARHYGRADLTDADVAWIQAVFVDCGAVAQVRSLMDRLVHEALDALDGVPIVSPAATALADLAHFVAGRDY